MKDTKPTVALMIKRISGALRALNRGDITDTEFQGCHRTDCPRDRSGGGEEDSGVKYQLLMECRGGVRHAFRTVMIIVLKDGTYKLHKVCMNCKSEKFPIWNTRGVILKSPTYRHSKEYREFLNDHTPAEARMAILGSDIKKVKQPHEGNTRNPGLRLVPKGTKAAKRRRNSRAHKRTADKRWHAHA